ncbi:hypothetical protein ElyMa_000125300 [Elysia marginata]|uniref:Uncharacterized protein n=1 Tax=Elysia marginata TaxID=1093978 RepID=A0AAV4EMH1_9GAST|nr:hypothetical protein ElyMa_000125300 [Elysia marginata]
MAKQTGDNERGQAALSSILGSSVDSPGKGHLPIDTGQGSGTAGRRGDGTKQQTYYCSPPYFSSSSSASSSSSSSPVVSPGESRGATASEYPEYRGRAKSGSTGTPLTPQEFELLSDSNPFKQDIAEKYGIAYPGITTRAHSSEFIGQAERQTESDVAEFGGAGRKKRSASVNDSVDSFTLDISTWRASSEKISRMCRGLNAFLLKNQESIEQSIASLDDTDVVIPTSEGAGVFSAPKKYDVVYVGKQNSCEEINSPVHDISPERLLDAELTEIQFEGKRGSLYSSDSRESLNSNVTSDLQPSNQSAVSMLSRPKQVLEQSKSDPYSAIKSEDTQRKKTGTKKVFSSAQSGRTDSEDDQLSFEPLSTRSFEESSLVSQGSWPALAKESELNKDKCRPNQPSGSTTFTSALTNRNADLLSFDDDEGSQVPASQGRGKQHSVNTKLASTSLSSPHSKEPTQVKVKTITNVNTSARPIDSVRNNQDQNTNDNRKSSVKRGGEISPPHEILATFDPYASVEKPDKKSLDEVGSDTQSGPTQDRGEKFSSSFYSVFSTTVSSLEDIDTQPGQTRVEKTDTSPEHHSCTWGTGDTTPSADSVFSAFSTGYERSISEGSQGYKESLNYSPGDLVSQKRPKASEDSGESSKESVSRDSMRVNLSQDSSVTDLQEEPHLLSHLQINGLPENGEDTVRPPVNTLPRVEIGLPQRHLDLASMLLPMAESASTDSMFVHVSTDSLHSATSGKSGEGHEPEIPEQRKLSDKSSRAQLSIDLRRKNLMEQSRRRSLPSSQFKNVDQGKPKSPVLYASQSLDSTDTPEHPLQRRSSVPASRPRPSAARTLQRIGSTSAPKLQYRESESEIAEVAAENTQGGVSKMADPAPDVSKLQPTSPPQAVSPSTARPRPSSKRGSVSGEKGAPVSINLGQVASILAGTTVSSTQPTTTKVKTQKLQRTKIQFTIAAKAPVPTAAEKESAAVPEQDLGSGTSSFSSIDRQRPPSLPHQPNADGTGFLQERKDEMSSVNTVQPPDLVPYEETFNSPMRSLPEMPQPALEETLSLNESKIKPASTNDLSESSTISIIEREQGEGGSDIKLTNSIVDETKAKPKTDIPNPGSSSSLGKPVTKQAEVGDSSSRNSIVKSNSGSDSDGGDIDTIVQEFKEDISEEDDIDDVVKEFIDEHPEAAVASPRPEPEISRQHSVGFNKLGRVLNKMQSVTKYMSKKKTIDEAPKSPPAKKKLGRRSRTTSQNDNEDVTPEPSTASVQHHQKEDENQTSEETAEKKDEADPFELLTKAAEVFKAQTVNKKRSPRHRAARVWRSMTVDHDVADLENNDDCDLVTRAAVLFKGFKGKRAMRDEGATSSGVKDTPGSSQDGEVKKEPRAEHSKEEERFEENQEVDKPTGLDTLPTLRESSNVQEEEKEQVSVSYANDASLPSIASVPVSPQEGLSNAKPSTSEDKPTDASIDTDTNTEMEESVSKMDDSGFESCIRYAAENSVRSDDDDDDTDGPGKVNSLLDSAREHAVFSVVDVTTPEITTYENVTCKLGPSIQDYVEKCMLTSADKTVVYDRSRQDIITGDGIILNEVEWPQTESNKCVDIRKISEAEGGKVMEHQMRDSKMITSSTTDDQSAATDSGLEMELKPEQAKPKDSRPVSQTCDLILSTGYDDSKNATKLQASESSERVDAATASADAREKTNGKLEELTKEILAVEAARYDAAPNKPERNKLNIQPPEYQRMSSESSENPDSNSLTVNLPDSPENGMSLAGDNPFSLCCGANFKINLNCTAMMKKPERRPSKVVIENKRCAMTEEEKLFPLKVSSSFRDNFDKDDPPESEKTEKQKDDTGATGVSKTTSNTLKVNEHERNRDFAGSREELTDPRKGSHSKNPENESNKENKDGELGNKSQKRRSLVEDLDKDKVALDNYDTVLNELSQKQEENVTGVSSVEKAKDTCTDEALERREKARSKRYGRVISESELDGGLLPTVTDEMSKSQQHTGFNTVTVEVPVPKPQKEEDQRQGNANEDVNAENTVTYPPESNAITSEPMVQACLAIQQSTDVYDNIKMGDIESRPRDEPPPPLPERDPRRCRSHSTGGKPQNMHRYHTPAGSMSSVVSDEGGRQGIRADVYLKARRAYIVQPQGKTKWVSSTPHLPTIERGGDIRIVPAQNTRHSSFPHLHANSDLDVSATPGHPDNYNYKTHHRVHSDGSASSFGSNSVCWGNYARVADLQLQERAPSCDDSESSTSGLFIPGGGGGIPAGCGRASTLSDVSDGYIFGDYSTVKDDIQSEENRGVIRPLDNQNQQADYSFRFRHFPAENPHVHYENIEDLVVTTQPMGGPRQWASGPDIYCDNNYAVIGQPQQFRPGYRVQAQPTSGPAVSMSSIGVQMSGSPSLARQGRPLRVSNCASQTSLDSLIGLVSHDASDILEGLPVYEYTLGAGIESEDEHSEGHSFSAAASTQCPDLGQPDVTQQTASLDRQQLRYKKKKSWEVTTSTNNTGNIRQASGHHESGNTRARSVNPESKRKETRVTFSRDAVLTEVIDELRKSEVDHENQQQHQDQQDNAGVVSSGRGLRGIASSTLTSIGGGVKEFARIINSPFHCCRSGRAEPKERPKVGGPVVF